MRFESVAIARATASIAVAAALFQPPAAMSQQTAPVPASAPDTGAPSRGQLLYDTYCVQCHTSQIHWRDARAARDWTTLRAEVERWQGQTGQRWPDEDIDAVTRYLSDTIYHYRDPRERG